MRILLIVSIAAGATGYAFGFLFPRKETPEPVPEATVAPDVAAPSIESPPDPSWQPGLVASIESTSEPEAFRQLLLEILERAPAGVERDEWMKVVVARWVDLHGREAYFEILRGSQWAGLERERELRPLLAFAQHRVALANLTAAIGYGGGSDPRDSPLLGALILERYPERLPGLISCGNFSGSATDWRKAGERLAEAGWEHVALIEAALAKPDYPATGSPVRGFLEKIALTDPEGTLAWAARVEGTKVPTPITDELGASPASFARQAAIRALAATDLERAKQVAAEWKSDAGASTMLAGLIAETDLPGAVDWLVSVNGDADGRVALSALGPALARLSTAEALSYFERFGANESSGHYGNGFWMNSNSATARFVRSLGEEAAPGLAGELAALPPSPARDTMLADALLMWANNHPDDAIQRALALSQTENIPGIALNLAEILGREPAHLLDFAAAVPAERQNAFFTRAASLAVEHDPQPFAAALVAGLDQPGAVAATEAFVTAWGGDGLRAPSEWLRTLPNGAPRDAGIHAFVGAVAALEPDSALLWSQSIGDAAVRLDALQTSFRPWANADPAGAEAAVAALTLSEAERQALVEFVRNPTPAPFP